MKLKYQINLVATGILLVVAIAIGLAGAMAIDQVTRELNRKLMVSELQNILGNIREAHQVLKDNRVAAIESYVKRAKGDLLDEYRNFSFGKSGSLLIIDVASGVNLLGRGAEDGLDEACLKKLVTLKSGVSECSNHAVDNLMSFGSYPDWQWLAVVSVTTKEILEARNRFLWQVALILLCSLVGGILLFVWFTGRFITPIRQLTVAAARVSEGRWDAPLPQLKGNNEIAQLSRIFQEMSHNLAETYEKLQENLDEIAKSQEELQVSKEQFRALVETTSDLVWEVNERGAYTYVSPQVCKLLGYEAYELVGKSPQELQALTNEDVQTVARYGELLQGREPFSGFERRMRHQGGEVVIMESSGMPFFDTAGNRSGFRGIDRDITDRQKAREQQQKLQAQLIHAQKMESIGRLAGGVAHDFNNMLSVIMGNIDLALDEIDPRMPYVSYFQEIQKAAERSAGITRQLLAFARKQTVNPQEVNLNKAVGELLKMLRRLIGEDIDLVWKPGNDIWPIQLDATQLDQIMVNLCVNSRDAIGDTGTITISTDNVQLDTDFCVKHSEVEPGEYVLLKVSDDGCGMNREVMENLFEPFFTTKEQGKGTGLGLATVYGIVRQNGGTIEVASSEGSGSTFSIYFPRFKSEQTDEAEQPHTAGGKATRGTLLLVEDEVMILKMTATMLSRVGYKVLQAASPAAAIELAEEHVAALDLVVTDVVMPEMNGLDLMRKISALRPEIKCLFMSGYPADVIAHHGILDKGVYFIQKPFTRESLTEKIREILAA